jgi:NAD(P)-dependent dehydrogenase (short-subunit alcohol dehydrogenase family)
MTPMKSTCITLIFPVLITGVSPKSLGESMAFSIASQKPALLILASRTRSKIDAVAAKIKGTLPDILLKTVSVDFSSQGSVRNAAEEIGKLTNKIHVLINNAGLMVPEHRFTKEGIELQFGTNHIGPFLFTNLLIDKLRRAATDATPGRKTTAWSTWYYLQARSNLRWLLILRSIKDSEYIDVCLLDGSPQSAGNTILQCTSRKSVDLGVGLTKC